MKSKMKSYMQEDEIVQQLESMLKDATYLTKPGYSIDTEKYPDHVIPFIQEHLNYLKKHPQVNPENYLSNLRLMLKRR